MIKSSTRWKCHKREICLRSRNYCHPQLKAQDCNDEEAPASIIIFTNFVNELVWQEFEVCCLASSLDGWYYHCSCNTAVLHRIRIGEIQRSMFLTYFIIYELTLRATSVYSLFYIDSSGPTQFRSYKSTSAGSVPGPGGPKTLFGRTKKFNSRVGLGTKQKPEDMLTASFIE